jgi:hypothetical protein
MIKIIEHVEKEAEKGVYHSYNPNNISLINFNPRQSDKFAVRFGTSIIDKKNRNDGLYLAP